MQRVKRESSAINELWVYPYEGKCTVMFKDGHIYEYTGVRRRALFNVLVNPSVSLGKWVNKNWMKTSSGLGNHVYVEDLIQDETDPDILQEYWEEYSL